MLTRTPTLTWRVLLDMRDGGIEIVHDRHGENVVYETVDLGGRYVLPGLINMHVHLPASGKPKKKASDPKKLVKLITSCGLMNKIGVNMCEGLARLWLHVLRAVEKHAVCQCVLFVVMVHRSVRLSCYRIWPLPVMTYL